MSRGLVRAGAYRAVPAWLRRLVGDQAEALLARVALDGALAADGLLAFDAGAALLDEAARISGRDEVGVQLASELLWADLGVLAYVALNAPTVGRALVSTSRYVAVQQTAGAVALDLDGDVARVSYALRAAPHEPPRQHGLAVLAILVRLIREGLGEPGWAPHEVTMPHAPPRRPGDGAAWFGVPIRYRAEAASVAFAPAVLRRPMVTADPGLFPILVRLADECLARLAPGGDDTLAEVRRLVASMIGSAALTIDDVAARMGVSARTVQRQLQAHALSFKQVVDDVRCSLARRHLADPDVTLTDAAFLLGYSDLSAFSRAFRRWTGQSAQAYRRAQLATSAAAGG